MQHRNFIVLVTLQAGLIFYLATFIPRHDHLPLIAIYTLSFLLSWLISNNAANSIRYILFGALLCRAVIIFSEPKLSDDVYRYLWDADLILHGIDIFDYTPRQLLDVGWSSTISAYLYPLLNSKNYFTVYPPLHLIPAIIGVFIAPDQPMTAIIIIRLFLICADLLVIVLLFKSRVNTDKIALYAFNPLVILELTGNLHFEGLVLLFLLMATRSVQAKKITSSALAFGAGVATKLTPFIAGPLFFLRTERRWLWLIVSALFIFILFSPLLNSSLLSGMKNSLSLYFTSFEFNASLYYIFRWVGFQVTGYNIIQSLGPALAIVSGILILSFSYYSHKNNVKLSFSLMIIYSIYLFMSTTVHPWYIIPAFGLSLFTPFRFIFYWTFLIFFSYIGYSQSGYELPLSWIVVEYIVVYALFIYEIFRFRRYFHHSG